MKIVEGRMVYEPRACYSCDGAGSRDYNVLCPLWNSPVTKYPGRVCPHCGTKNRHGHKTVGTEHRQCDSCRGIGHPMETAYDSVPAAIVAAIPVRVYRSNRPQTWMEAHLAVGCLVSITDYGRYKSLTDTELAAKVKGEDLKSPQAISGIVSREDHGRVCSHIGVFTSDQGYSVIGVFEKGEK
jgi:hypothetical protein